MSEKPKLSLSGYHASRIGSATHSQVQSGKDARNSTNTSTTVLTAVLVLLSAKNTRNQRVALTLSSQEPSQHHSDRKKIRALFEISNVDT